MMDMLSITSISTKADLVLLFFTAIVCFIMSIKIKCKHLFFIGFGILLYLISCIILIYVPIQINRYDANEFGIIDYDNYSVELDFLKGVVFFTILKSTGLFISLCSLVILFRSLLYKQFYIDTLSNPKRDG